MQSPTGLVDGRKTVRSGTRNITECRFFEHNYTKNEPFDTVTRLYK